MLTVARASAILTAIHCGKTILIATSLSLLRYFEFNVFEGKADESNTLGLSGTWQRFTI